MVEVIYDGNLGNNLYQYCFGRILAEKLGYALKANPINGYEGTNEIVKGKDFSSGFSKIRLKGQKVNLDFLKEENPQYHIVLTGYFQRYEYYKEHRIEIKEWLRLDDQLNDEMAKSITPRDLVMGVRRGSDYIPHHGLPISYYEEAISKFQYDRLFICSNDTSDAFVNFFVKKYHAIPRNPGALDNMMFIKKFNNIIISNSTFLWWASYLSDAKKIVYPRPQNGFWAPNERLSKNIDLEISEERYIYLIAEKYSSEFLSERIMQWKNYCLHSLKNILKTIFPFLKKEPMKANIDFNEDFDS